MLQSPILPEHQSAFHFENNNWNLGRSRMNARDSIHNQRCSPATAYLAPPASSLAEASAAHHGYEPTIPRSYSHSPSASMSTAASPDGADFHPWIFQLFPDPYTDASAYPTPMGGQYMQGADGSFVYGQASSSSSRPLGTDSQYDERIHGDTHRTDTAFYQAYDGARTLQEIERDPKGGARLSPFSEYDSSSSECDPRDWASHSDYSRSPQLGSHSDYSRSPQLGSHSRGSTTRSSPQLGVYSPVLTAGPIPGPRSNPSGYTHLVAQFPGPTRTKTRKVRRKLEPREREQVHQLRKIGACTKCWGLKMKCDDGSPCKRCEKTGAGALCVRVHFVDLDVFSKWLVDSYSRQMMHHTLRFTNAAPRTVVVSHDRVLGVTMQLNVYEFIPGTTEELNYWYRDATGWQSMPTTPFAMKRGINTDILEKYIQDHTYYFVESAFRGSGNQIMAEIFMAAFKYSRTEENFLLRDALQLWTANQLLIRGATLQTSPDNLGILPIPSPSSPQAGQTPLPRVLSDQINHLLERRIWQLEKQILCELQKRIFGRKREDWLKIFFTMVVFMNALERDSWRLYYSMFHSEGGYVWQHPSTPKKLIEKNETLAISLSAHFAAISKGLTPFALEWSREQTLGLIGNYEDPEGILGAMERIGRGLRNPDHALFTSNVLSHYRQDDERSLDFLYSSKVMNF